MNDDEWQILKEVLEDAIADILAEFSERLAVSEEDDE